MDGLFPGLPEDVKALSDEDLNKLLEEHVEAAALIDADDEEFLAGLDGDSIIQQYTAGVEQINTLRAEAKERAEAHEAFQAKKAELSAQIKAEEEPPPDPPQPPDDGDEGSVAEPPVEVVAEEEGDEGDEGEGEGSKVEEKELVLASAESGEESTKQRFARKPPAPSVERTPKVVEAEPVGTALVAAGELSLNEKYRGALDPMSLADLVKDSAMHHGPHAKVDSPGKYRFGGPEHKIARQSVELPDDRQLTDDASENFQKIMAVGTPFWQEGQEALVASGGLCAPLEPFYSMPNFATDAEPVWDALPKFQARRGGVNTPEATTIGDITTAISSISEANDALGGTFATKSCQDLTCPSYTEVAVQILAHCREYGNLNARAWPEKIAHENALTMAALSRTSEAFLLDRLKALSINVTNGAETLGALIYLVDAIVKAKFGIMGRLRMPRSARFRAYLPYWVPDMLALDTVQTIDGNRFRSKGELVSYLGELGIDPVFYLDTASTGTTQLPDAAQTAAAIDALPDNVQWAIHPEGAFLGIDSGSLELGIVRDSVLNATNDFQVFGERFRNVARIGPAQSAYWVTSDLCAIGQFPPAGTARTCD